MPLKRSGMLSTGAAAAARCSNANPISVPAIWPYHAARTLSSYSAALIVNVAGRAEMSGFGMVPVARCALAERPIQRPSATSSTTAAPLGNRTHLAFADIPVSRLKR